MAQLFAAADVDLAAGTGGRGAERDVLRGIEHVYGTTLGDVLSGDDSANLLSGGGGADNLQGRGGDDLLIAGGTDGAPDTLLGGEGNDRFLVGAGLFVADGGGGADRVDFSGGTDPLDGGGRTLSLELDLADGFLARRVETGRAVWADDGGTAARTHDGQSIAPEDVLRADPAYARAAADLSLRLPGADNPDVGRFAITEDLVERSLPVQELAVERVEHVTGSSGDDTIRGDGSGNALDGADGNDRLTGRGGNDTLDGGDGTDVASYGGAAGHYRVTLGAEGHTVADKRGTEGTDTLRGIERLEFADGYSFVAEDQVDLTALEGVATLDAAQLTYFVEMYIAYFDRAPDSLGLFYWGDRLSEGMTLPEIAASFFVQPESQAVYPDPDDNARLVNDAYANLLERAPDEEGRAYWINALEQGDVSRAEFMLAIINGAKAETGSAADVKVIREKADIGLAFAVIEGLNDVSDAAAAMAAYERSDAAASLSRAAALIDTFAAEAAAPGSGQIVVGLSDVVDDPFA